MRRGLIRKFRYDVENPVAREALEHVIAFFPRLDQADIPEFSEVRAHVLDREGSLLSDCLHRLLSRRVQVEDLQALRTRERLTAAASTGCKGRHLRVGAARFNEADPRERINAPAERPES